MATTTHEIPYEIPHGETQHLVESHLKEKFLTPSESKSWFGDVVLLVLSFVIIAIGAINLSIYDQCSAADKPSAFLNYEISAFAVGFGVGIVAYLILGLAFRFWPAIALLLLALLLIVVSSINVAYVNAKNIDVLLVLNIALIGVGVGIALGFTIAALGWLPLLEQLRIMAIFTSVAAIVFASVGINIYNNKCHKPPGTSAYLTYLGIAIAIAALALLVTIGSYFIPPGA